MIGEKYLKHQINFRDQDWDRWILLRFSSFFKEEIRLDRAEIELIESYRLALDKIYEAIKNEQLLCNPRIEEEEDSIARPHAMVFKTYSLGIPFLFITRHLIELSIKRFLESKGNKIQTGHKISALWEKCLSIAPGLNSFSELISCITILDDDELHFRYAKDQNGQEYDNKPVFINYTKIYRQAKRLSINLVPTTTVDELKSK